MFNNRLSGGLVRSSALLIAILGLCSSKSWADSITFHESAKDYLDCSKDWGCDTSTRGKFTMKGLFFPNLDPSTLADLLFRNTHVTIIVGNWGGRGILADDGSYQNGDTKAMIRCNAITNTCMIGRRILTCISTDTIKFSCSSKGIAISALSNGDAYWQAIADEIAGQTGAVTNILAISIVLSNNVIALTTNIHVTVTGAASVKSVNKRGDVFDLNSVKVNGRSHADGQLPR